MSKLLIILALFAFIELYVQGRSHRIPLKRGSSHRKNAKPLGFLEESPTLERIDLNYPYFARANIGDMTDNLLAISLFNSFLFLSNCPDTFKYFNCSAEPSSCFYPVHKKRDGFDFPYYSLEGTYVMVNMSLGTYGRGERIMTLYADKCSKNSYNNNEVMGAVGLSLRDNNYENFDTVDNKFSIWLERDGSDGELIFGEDSSCEADEPYINLVGVTLDWELRLAQINFMESKYDYLQGMAIFDINSNFIGIPEHIHWHLMRDLKQRHNFVCAKEMLTPNCTFSGDINSLPDLTLSMADGGSVITIPPAVYTRKLPEENLYTCLLVSLEKDPVDAHQLPVTECYRNYIVLGSPFMQYYYTVFNYENVDEPQIRLYVPKENSDI